MDVRTCSGNTLLLFPHQEKQECCLMGARELIVAETGVLLTGWLDSGAQTMSSGLNFFHASGVLPLGPCTRSKSQGGQLNSRPGGRQYVQALWHISIAAGPVRKRITSSHFSISRSLVFGSEWVTCMQSSPVTMKVHALASVEASSYFFL